MWSADLGGRVGWLPKAKRVKTLFLSPLQPQNAGGGWGGGGGVGRVSRLRFPPGPHLRSSRFSRHPRLRQAPTRRFAKNRKLLTSWRLKPMHPGLKTLGCYHNPQSADLGGRWMVSEGSHERRFPSSLQHFS